MNLFEPAWTLKIGEHQISGNGILGRQRPSDDLIDLFAVTMNGTQLIVLPKEGKVMQNLVTVLDEKPGTLIWSRTMQLIMGGRWPERRCSHYSIGIKNNERHGFKLFEDGKVERGL